MALETGQPSKGTVQTGLQENVVGLPGILMQGIAAIAPSFAILASFVFLVSAAAGAQSDRLIDQRIAVL